MITSKSNENIKEIRSLKEKKFRYEYKKYIVEGYKSVKEALNKGERVEVVVISESYTGERDFKAPILTVSEPVFSSLTDEKNPQGILAVLYMKGNVAPKNHNALILDGISDPGNLGTLIRTAAACGIEDVYLINSADPYNPKAVRSTMSGIFYVNLIIGGDELLEDIELPIISADMCGEDAFSFKAPEKFALAVGNEARGLSEKVRKASKYVVKVPMQNVESLNAGVAGSILMYLLKSRRA